MLYWLQNSTPFKLAPPGKRGSLGLEWLEGLLYHTRGTFFQQTLLEALIVTGGSASYFGEQYRDLLLDLYQKLDENNSSNQQVLTAVQQYIQQYTMVAGIAVGNPDVVRLPASSRSTGRRQVGSHERFSEHVENVVVVVVVVVVFTLKTVLTSIQYPSLSYSSRQRNEFPWSQANPK